MFKTGLKSDFMVNKSVKLDARVIKQLQQKWAQYTRTKMVIWCQMTFFKLAGTFVSQSGVDSGAESTPGLSWSARLSPRSFVWIPSWHSGQFLARVQAGSEYKMTTSAVSFLPALFFFVRRKGVGREQPHFALLRSRVRLLHDSTGPS